MNSDVRINNTVCVNSTYVEIVSYTCIKSYIWIGIEWYDLIRFCLRRLVLKVTLVEYQSFLGILSVRYVLSKENYV